MEAFREMSRLRLRRVALGWPQWQLARASGVSIYKVSFAERGFVGVLSRADRRRLAAALDVDEHVLFPNVEECPWQPAPDRMLALTDATGAVKGLPGTQHRGGDGDG